MIYDVHAHHIPSRLIELLRSEGDRFGMEIVDTDGTVSARTTAGAEIGVLRPILSDPDRRLASMDAAGVDIQILSSWVDLTAYSLAPANGSAYARAFNTILAEEAASVPGRFLALATVPLQAPEAAAEELRHAVEELGMVGVEIATTVGPRDLDQADLEPFWEAAASLRCLVLLHPMTPLTGVDLGRHFLDNMVGRPAESTIAIAHLIFSGVFDRHPDLIVCVVHGGGFLPYQLGRLRRGYTAVPRLAALDLRTDPREVAARLYYDTVLHSPEALGFLVASMGADRVVLGTDYPFEMGDPEPVATVQGIPGLTEDERQLILGGNVERLLAGLDQGASSSASPR